MNTNIGNIINEAYFNEIFKKKFVLSLDDYVDFYTECKTLTTSQHSKAFLEIMCESIMSAEELNILDDVDMYLDMLESAIYTSLGRYKKKANEKAVKKFVEENIKEEDYEADYFN